MNFPLRYLYDDRKLRDRALTEFARVLRNDRMIALTGSMSDEALGYFPWKGFEQKLGEIAREIARETAQELNVRIGSDTEAGILLGKVEEHAAALKRKDCAGKMEARVRFGIIRDCLDSLSSLPALKQHAAAAAAKRAKLIVEGQEKGLPEPPISPMAKFMERVAGLFQTRPTRNRPNASAIKPLLESLGIARIATLNYDLELERALMLRADERKIGEKSDIGPDYRPNRPVLDWVGDEQSGRPILCDRIGRLSRVMGDGLTVESDIMNRERADRLFEFAIGSAEVDRHILHLHGRADRPKSMVVTIRDYDLLYRRDDLFRNPFEHGMRVLFAGNPVLFVGLGMTEGELNEFLQYFVSNTPYKRMAPAFLVWNTLGLIKPGEGPLPPETEAEKAERIRAKEEMRFNYLQKLGIHVIFDEDLLPANYASDARENWVEEARTEHRAATGEARRAVELSAMVRLLSELPPVVADLRDAANRAGGDHWRSIQHRIVVKGDGPDARVDLASVGEGPTAPQATGGGALSTQRWPVRVWGTPTLLEHASEELARFEPVMEPPTGPFQPLLVGVATPGAGRGTFSELIAQKRVDEVECLRIGTWEVAGTKLQNRLLINAGFSYDSDAMLNAIAIFLQSRRAQRPAADDPVCREQGFADGTLFEVEAPSLIIINGIDRFFGFDGQPLSAELDHLLRCVLKQGGTRARALAEATADAAAEDGAGSNGRPMKNEGAHEVQWLLLGTDRIRRYFDALNVGVQDLGRNELALALPPPTTTSSPTSPEPAVRVGSCYLDWVARLFSENAPPADRADTASQVTITPAAKARIKEAVATDRDSIRRAFFAGYLAPQLLQALGFDCPTTFEVLRTMAFIGVPVEAEVLLHAPKIAAIVRENRDEKSAADVLKTTLDNLVRFGLILPMAPWRPGETAEPWYWQRYGLHRSLATELRERHGAPISEAKLSTTFNMSLFAAQPGDTYTPDEQFHDELGELVDRLIGAFKDKPGACEADNGPVDDKAFYASSEAPKLMFRPPRREMAFEEFNRLRQRHSAACLRAALAVVRGYYSTSSLLTLGSESHLVNESREGALSEHSQRLDRILKGFGKIATARQIFRELGHRKIADPAQRSRAIERSLGPDPFYADDLVWLHNERGVVKLAQGHLYDARRSFRLADDANRRSLEFQHRGHNWRRITINMIGLLIERGRLRRAERRIEEIEESVEKAQWLGPRDAERNPRRVETIRERFGKASVISYEGLEFTREEILMVGLTTCYRALIEHMRGKYRDAESLYPLGISILRCLDEARAYSMFQRHFATLGRHLDSTKAILRETELAIAAADGVLQKDISHRARIVRAIQLRRDPKATPAQRRVALLDLQRALHYAALTDSYRVRIEASKCLAHHMRESGDYDTALRYASDALAIACRYGHSLHKISLRVDIGQILIERGDPISGMALLDRAVQSAMRAGYHRTIERVQSARRLESAASLISLQGQGYT